MTEDLSQDPKQVLLNFVLDHIHMPNCAQLLLFIAVFEQNVELVEQALDNGAHVNQPMTGTEKRILEVAGYNIYGLRQ